MNEDDFQLTKEFKSYVSKPEITDLSPNFLVKGSKNVIIDNAQRIVSRLGYILFGAAGSNSAGGIKGSYEWETSTGSFFPLRSYDDKLEFYWNSTWNLLKSGLTRPYLQFAKVWDNTEKIDVLLWVLGESNTYKWSGGVQKVRSSTATTLTKQGVITSQTTIAFIAGTPGTVSAQITDSNGNFLNAGFAAGDTLTVSGSAANSRNFTIGSVTATTITLSLSDVVTTEAAGPSITLHNGSPTWASSRFLTTGTRKITYLGIEYTYTGGENTDTLTGLTAFPTVTLGDPVWQTSIALANSVDIASTFKQDLIGVTQNQVVLGSTKSRDIYGSQTTDYTNFHLTSPRAPADPFKVTMDNNCTCIISADNPEQNVSALMFGGGTSDFFKLTFTMSQDLTNELVRMVKLKTATSAGIISVDAITEIKRATAYISREPALDTISNLQTADTSDVPISDLIKNDFDSYDFTDAHVKYVKRGLYVALPAEGIVLIYDMVDKLWQPPQYMPISRFAIINDLLHGHSSVTNETYQLFTGTSDNGAFIPQVARFAYNNAGRRDRLKNMSEYWSDGYISPNGQLTETVNIGFGGTTEKKVMTISGSDSEIAVPLSGSTLGDEPLGSTPIGGATLGVDVGLASANGTLLRYYQEDTMSLQDYLEFYVEYSMNTLDGQFAVVAHGNNQWDAGTSPVTHKK
jgi:hypothetical protein